MYPAGVIIYQLYNYRKSVRSGRLYLPSPPIPLILLSHDRRAYCLIPNGGIGQDSGITYVNLIRKFSVNQHILEDQNDF